MDKADLVAEAGLAIAGAGLVLSMLLGLKLRLPSAMDANLDPLRTTPRPPNMTAEVVPQSGPIVITVEYRIDPENRDAFVAIMRELRVALEAADKQERTERGAADAVNAAAHLRPASGKEEDEGGSE